MKDKSSVAHGMWKRKKNELEKAWGTCDGALLLQLTGLRNYKVLWNHMITRPATREFRIWLWSTLEKLAAGLELKWDMYLIRTDERSFCVLPQQSKKKIKKRLLQLTHRVKDLNTPLTLNKINKTKISTFVQESILVKFS